MENIGERFTDWGSLVIFTFLKLISIISNTNNSNSRWTFRSDAISDYKIRKKNRGSWIDKRSLRDLKMPNYMFERNLNSHAPCVNLRTTTAILNQTQLQSHLSISLLTQTCETWHMTLETFSNNEEYFTSRNILILDYSSFNSHQTCWLIILKVVHF